MIYHEVYHEEGPGSKPTTPTTQHAGRSPDGLSNTHYTTPEGAPMAPNTHYTTPNGALTLPQHPLHYPRSPLMTASHRLC